MKKFIKPALISLALVLIMITGSVAVRRSLKGSNDFDTFYDAGKAVRAHTGIYYIGEGYEEATNQGPFLYPPIAACFFSFWALFPIAVSAFVWNFFCIALFGFCIYLILRIFQLNRKILHQTFLTTSWPVKVAFVAMAIALLLDNLTMAQINLLVFAVTLAALVLEQSKKSFIAGLILAFAVMIKLTPVIFCFYFLIKRRWKLLAGTATGMLLFTLIIPTLFFGVENNRLFHRQWLGRTIKPVVIRIADLIHPEDSSPYKKSADLLHHNNLENLLVDKNQSLPATMTRLLLKDRKRFGYFPRPIYVARRYENMPVLFGGIEQKKLEMLIGLIYPALAVVLLIGWWPSLNTSSAKMLTEYALAFLCMTLFSPLARSHQFISWLFPYFALILGTQTGIFPEDKKNGVQCALIFSAIFYILQGLPYGKAAGMGTFANLILFALFLSLLFKQRKSQTSFPAFHL